MSLATKRVELAQALCAVSGVAGYEYPPNVWKTGDAWPVLDTLDLEQGLVWRPTWLVHVVLPADPRKASEWMDEHFIDIANALRVPSFAERAEPIDVQTDQGPVSLLQITTRSE